MDNHEVINHKKTIVLLNFVAPTADLSFVFVCAFITFSTCDKKKIYYQKFLHSILKSKILRGCKFLIDFLKEQD